MHMAGTGAGMLSHGAAFGKRQFPLFSGVLTSRSLSFLLDSHLDPGRKEDLLENPGRRSLRASHSAIGASLISFTSAPPLLPPSLHTTPCLCHYTSPTLFPMGRLLDTFTGSGLLRADDFGLDMQPVWLKLPLLNTGNTTLGITPAACCTWPWRTRRRYSSLD